MGPGCFIETFRQQRRHACISAKPSNFASTAFAKMALHLLSRRVMSSTHTGHALPHPALHKEEENKDTHRNLTSKNATREKSTVGAYRFAL